MNLIFTKYQNRKLHQRGSTGMYTTMQELLSLVEGGTRIKVLDDVTGDDVTVPVVGRLIYDRARSGRLFGRKELMRLLTKSPSREVEGYRNVRHLKLLKLKNRQLHIENVECEPEIQPGHWSYLPMEELLYHVTRGAEIEVFDVVKGVDITDSVLARLVYERCRQHNDSFDPNHLFRLLTHP